MFAISGHRGTRAVRTGARVRGVGTDGAGLLSESEIGTLWAFEDPRRPTLGHGSDACLLAARSIRSRSVQSATECDVAAVQSVWRRRGALL